LVNINKFTAKTTNISLLK